MKIRFTCSLLLVAASFNGLVAEKKKAKKQRAKYDFLPNCASQKLCNKPLEEREPWVNAPSKEDSAGAPKGHLKPLGHADFDDSWDGEIPQLTELDPHTFWKEYFPYKPFILKGFGKKSPAFEKWKNDTYLGEHFGMFKMKTEQKNEDRLSDYCGLVKFNHKIVCPKTGMVPYVETYMKLGKFLPLLQSQSFDKYVITQMPDAMGDDFVVPNFASCMKRDPADPGPKGNDKWKAQLYENNFWFAKNGGNNFSTSVIHYDMNHQIMCQFDGTKEWIMWDMFEQGKHIPMWSKYFEDARRPGGQPSGSDDSPIDGEKVDLKRFPEFAKARWINGTLEAGDCLYTPAWMLHYVRSRSRNVAAMTMWQTSESYDPTCGGHEVGEPAALSQYDYMWSFPDEDKQLLGWNVVKMGFPNWKLELTRIMDAVRKQGGTDGVDAKQFRTIMARTIKEVVDSGDPNFSKSKVMKRMDKIWDDLDSDKNGKVVATDLAQNRLLRWWIKDVSIMQEGPRGEDREEDVEVHRYDMSGLKDEKHNVHLHGEL